MNTVATFLFKPSADTLWKKILKAIALLLMGILIPYLMLRKKQGDSGAKIILAIIFVICGTVVMSAFSISLYLLTNK